MHAKEVQAFFEKVAGDWDTMRLAYYDERVIEKMASVSGLTDAMTVADVGTGTGFVAAGVAPRVNKVVGIDNSPAMLATAVKNLDTLDIHNVDLIEGDTADLPLESDSMDAGFANMVLHHAADPVVMLAEMSRVIKPGGAVVIVDEVEHSYEWMREEHADVWLGFTPERIEDYFHEAGFGSIGYESLGMQ